MEKLKGFRGPAFEDTPKNRDTDRPSASVGDLRIQGTPNLRVEQLLSMLPTGHDKALKYAFYNVIAVIIAAGVILALWGVYCILEPFVKALMWAILCGSVLHPFKEQLCDIVRGWLKSSKESSVPFTLLVAASPLKAADSVSDKIGSNVQEHWRSIVIGITGFLTSYLIYHNPPMQLLNALQALTVTLWNVTTWTLSNVNAPVVITINGAYLIGMGMVMISRIKAQKARIRTVDSTDGSQEPIQDSTMPRSIWANPHLPWGITVVYFVLLLPYPLMLLLAICMGLGTNIYLRKRKKRSFKYTIPKISKLAYMMVLNVGKERSTSLSDSSARRVSRMQSHMMSPSLAVDEVDKKILQRSYSDGATKAGDQKEDSFFDNVLSPPRGDTDSLLNSTFSSDDDDDNETIESNKFLYGVCVACLVVFVWQRLWLVHLLPIPVVYYGLKKVGVKFGLKEFIKRKFEEYAEILRDASGEDLVPRFFTVSLEILQEGDRRLISICETYVDSVVSMIIVSLMVMLSVSWLIFAATQVYAEGDYLIRVSGDLINTTVSRHPEVRKMLPEGWETMLSSMVSNVFMYGREYITNAIRSSASADGTIEDQKNAQQLETQLVELWDKLYVAWNHTYENAFLNVTKSKSAQKDVALSWDDLFMIGKDTNLELSVVTDYAKANVGTLWSIMESLWNILVGNVSLAFSSVTSVVSLLVGGGSAIVNLLINLVIFFTTLFYLLSLSGAVYKPVELFNQFTTGTGEYTSNFALAVEESVNGVFVASIKMATFYGLWTWLTHTLFEVNIVFVPSIFGGLFAAVPFLMPYWAALPAVLELWLIQGRWWKALLMFCVQILPMSAVDAQIYSEIKGGGHPYLTGLAVAGGIFYFGFQGAIIGPMILCLVIVAVKVGRRFMWDEPH